MSPHESYTDNGYRETTLEEEQRFEAAHHLLEELEAKGVVFRLVEGEVRFRPASVISEEAKTELRHYKAEIYELLREEEEIEARRAALFAAQPEVDPMPEDEWEAFSELRDEEEDARWIELHGEEAPLPTSTKQLALFRWIGETLEAAPESERYRNDSYDMKHGFARAPEGFYVTDAQFRAAMWMSGHLGRYYPSRRYEDVESRYYYVRPNREGFVEKLARAGVPRGWAWDAIMPDVEEGEGRPRKEL